MIAAAAVTPTARSAVSSELSVQVGHEEEICRFSAIDLLPKAPGER